MGKIGGDTEIPISNYNVSRGKYNVGTKVNNIVITLRSGKKVQLCAY